MRSLLLTGLIVLPLLACKKDSDRDDTAPPEGDTDTDTDADGDTDTDADTDTDPETARWTVMVFMNGDNDLEGWVTKDLNELEQAGSGDGVHIVVQADRAEGYATDDGDWTHTRRYYIHHDTDDTQIVSEIVEEMGEEDMGSPETLSEFLLWADERYPAEQVLVVIWDHGGGWMMNDTPTLPGTSWDDSSGNDMSVAQGELQAGLQPLVDARGPIDVLAFDACNMAAWEVAHAFADQALTMVGSEATLGMAGLQYNLSLATLREQSEMSAAELADDLARQTVQEGGEWTMSAVDLGLVQPLSQAIDALAQDALANPDTLEALLEARDASQGTDHTYNNWYLDLGSLSENLQASSSPALVAAGGDIAAALDQAVIGSYTGGPYRFAKGLNILFDTRWMMHLRDYQNGSGATWSQDTHWDELLMQVAER
jgi:hypothetical protein